jgi:hypothetical protein
MNNKAILSTIFWLLMITVSENVSAAQCDTNYNYLNGHRSVRYADLLPKSIAVNVKICSDANVPLAWKTASQNAINNLNSNLLGINTHLHFSYVTSSCTFRISMSTSLTNEYARIYDPTKPGITAVYINAYKNPNSLLKEHILMHELLHTIGLGHTGKSYWYEVPGTDGYYDTYYAGHSIMCDTATDTVIYPQRYLNFLDKKALEIMYPK